MKVFSVAGFHHTGKTTLVVELIKELRRRGFSVTSIKDIHNENFTMGTVKVTYTNLRDSEADKDKQKKGFLDLVEMLEEDEFLLDNIDDGVYVRNRYLYEENDQLIGSYSGIFKSLKIDL